MMPASSGSRRLASVSSSRAALSLLPKSCCQLAMIMSASRFSESARLLIATPSHGGFRVVEAYSRIVRLGEGLTLTGRMSDEAMDRALAALTVCAEKIRRRKCVRIKAIATQACRQAENGPEFIARVASETGLRLQIITPKDDDGVEIIRHSTAHLLAYAVKQLFPEAQVTIGPVIENGFYYDFAYKRPFTPEDLVAIEKKMGELAAKDEPVVRRVLPRDEAVAHFKALGEHSRGVIVTQVFPYERSIAFPMVKEAQELAKAKGLELSPAMLEGYAAAKVLVEGLRRTGAKPTRAALTVYGPVGSASMRSSTLSLMTCSNSSAS